MKKSYSLTVLCSRVLFAFLFVSLFWACSDQVSNNGEKTVADGGTNTEVKKQEIRGAGPDKEVDPGKTGPYTVGVTTWRLTDPSRKDPATGKDMPMVVEIWYPAVDSAKGSKTDGYDVKTDAPANVQAELKRLGGEIPVLNQDAHRDAEPLREEGPYPLILFSHGSGGIRYQSVFQTVHLASHGYVVVSLDHHGNTMYDLIMEREVSAGGIARFAASRPVDMKWLYDLVKERVNKSGDLLHNFVRVEDVGITGHSYGGLTSILSTKTVPEIKVSIPQAPYTFSGYGGVKSEFIANTPVMVLAAQQDNTLDYQEEQKGFYDNMIKGEFFGAERHLITLKRGGHFSFSNICDFDLASFADKIGMGSSVQNILSDGCSVTDNTPIKEAHKWINYYSTALFNVILRKSESSRKYLKAVESDEITYTSAKP